MLSDLFESAEEISHSAPLIYSTPYQISLQSFFVTMIIAVAFKASSVQYSSVQYTRLILFNSKSSVF